MQADVEEYPAADRREDSLHNARADLFLAPSDNSSNDLSTTFFSGLAIIALVAASKASIPANAGERLKVAAVAIQVAIAPFFQVGNLIVARP